MFFITSLFVNALIAKDKNNIIIMRKIGVSDSNIQTQYLTSMMTCVLIGIITGTLLANVLGSKLLASACQC